KTGIPDLVFVYYSKSRILLLTQLPLSITPHSTTPAILRVNRHPRTILLNPSQPPFFPPTCAFQPLFSAASTLFYDNNLHSSNTTMKTNPCFPPPVPVFCVSDRVAHWQII